jgi:hypothetical protein
MSDARFHFDAASYLLLAIFSVFTLKRFSMLRCHYSAAPL